MSIKVAELLGDLETGNRTMEHLKKPADAEQNIGINEAMGLSNMQQATSQRQWQDQANYQRAQLSIGAVPPGGFFGQGGL